MPERLSGVRVALLEDHYLLAQSLRINLHAEGAEVLLPDLDALDEAVAQAESADVVLLDLDLGVAGDGSTLVGRLAAAAEVLVVTGVEEPARLGVCLQRGAAAVLPKTTPLADLLEAVVLASRGHPVMAEHKRLDLLAAARRKRVEDADRLALFDQLTRREQQVLAQLMHGRQVETIARDASVSEATVRSQIRSILTKLGAHSQLAAVASAHRAGWSGPSAT